MANEIRLLTYDPEPTAGTTYINFDGNTSSFGIAYNADAATWQAEAETIPALTGNISVSGDYQSGYVVEFVGALANTNVAATFDLNTSTMTAPAGDPTVAVITEGVDAVDEVQNLIADISPTGDWTVTFDGQTTSAITNEPDAATLQAALEALSNIGAGNVAVTGAMLSGFVITFQNDLGGQNLPEITVDGSGTDAAFTPSTTTNGVAGVAEVQRITIPNPLSGLVALSSQNWKVDTSHGTELDGTDSNNAAVIEAALEDFLGVGVSVTHNDNYDYTVTWDDLGVQSTLAPVSVDLLFDVSLNDATTQEGSGGSLLLLGVG